MFFFFFFSSRRRHTRWNCDWSSDVCSSDLPGDKLADGVSLWDAESDADLAGVAEAGLRAEAPVLWCGSSGLAGALAGEQQLATHRLPRPVLGLFGSDHPATLGQLDAAGLHHRPRTDGGQAS